MPPRHVFGNWPSLALASCWESQHGRQEPFQPISQTTSRDKAMRLGLFIHSGMCCFSCGFLVSHSCLFGSDEPSALPQHCPWSASALSNAYRNLQMSQASMRQLQAHGARVPSSGLRQRTSWLDLMASGNCRSCLCIPVCCLQSGLITRLPPPFPWHRQTICLS